MLRFKLEVKRQARELPAERLDDCDKPLDAEYPNFLALEWGRLAVDLRLP